ncbi:MAG: DUF892 family protein [Capsulimonadales bacterium]|nr:DUF892 family protein [Capsulimonadales bacterium]
MAEDAREKLIRYLNDTHAAEEAAIPSMEAIRDEAIDADLKRAIEQHIAVTRSQADRLEARIHALGGTVNRAKSLVNTVIGVGSHLVNLFHDKEDKQTQDLIKATALEQFEVSTYAALETYAESVGDSETARLAREIGAEEEQARQTLARLVPQVAAYALNRTEPVRI